jgi:sortase (surface protein transpeptidase)
MKPYKIFTTIFLIFILAVSTASAATYSSNPHKYSDQSRNNWNSYDKNSRTNDASSDNQDNSNAEAETSSGSDNDASRTDTYKLCKSNVCTVGGNGKVLTLTNYKNADNPSYDQLIKFLKKDKTDEKPYTNSYVCSDFARTLHNNAEKSGIRAGWVGVKSVNHAFNVFETTDQGTVYIDCTGVPGGSTLQDKQLYCVEGERLTGKYLFRDWNLKEKEVVQDMKVFW